MLKFSYQDEVSKQYLNLTQFTLLTIVSRTPVRMHLGRIDTMLATTSQWNFCSKFSIDTSVEFKIILKCCVQVPTLRSKSFQYLNLSRILNGLL